MKKHYEFFMYMQCNFNKYVSDKLFGELSDHIFEKWEKYEYNILNFLSCLDDCNKDLLFTWVNEEL